MPLLQENRDVLEADTADKFFYGGNYFNSAVAFFDFRKKSFLEKQQHYTWLSWNATDEYIKKALFPLAQTLSSK